MDEVETKNVNLDDLQELDAISAEIKELDDKLKALKWAKTSLQSALAESYLKSGLTKMSVNGRTYALRTDRLVSKKAGFSMEHATDALHAAGFDDLVSPAYRPQQVAALIREMHDDLPPGTPLEDAIPEGLREIFRAVELPKVVSSAS